MRISDWSSDVCSSDLYNDLAWPDNEAVLAELLAVRAERAHLLGYADWAEFEADVRMIGTGGAIPAFLARLDDASAAAAGRGIGRTASRGRVCRTCGLRWSPYTTKKKKIENDKY